MESAVIAPPAESKGESVPMPPKVDPGLRMTRPLVPVLELRNCTVAEAVVVAVNAVPPEVVDTCTVVEAVGVFTT